MNANKIKAKKDQIDYSVLNAAALQDHYLRQANLSLKPHFPQLNKTNKKPPMNQQFKLNTNTRETLQYSAQQILSQPYSNSRPDSQGSHSSNIDRMINYNLKKQTKNHVMIGHQKISLKNSGSKEDYRTQMIYDPEYHKKDDDESCAICLETYEAQDQVILSCSHTFHKMCLVSFEKHNKIKACPICRRQNYEKKVIDDGFKKFINKCAIVIQKIWRGGRVRIPFFKRLINEEYKAHSMLLRRKILGYKISNFSNKMIHDMQKKQQENEKVVQELYKNIQENQEKCEQNIYNMKNLKEKQKMQLNEYLMYGNENNVVITSEIQPNQNIKIKSKLNQQEWGQIKEKALQRLDQQCAICFNELFTKHKKDIYLLSCSHLFHANCLNAFERYNLDKQNTCPCCRFDYEKMHLKQQK